MDRFPFEIVLELELEVAELVVVEVAGTVGVFVIEVEVVEIEVGGVNELKDDGGRVSKEKTRTWLIWKTNSLLFLGW